MTYITVHKSKNSREPWSEEALELELRRKIAHHGLIDLEHLYTTAMDADSLNHMLHVLKTHLGIRSRKISAAFTDQIDGPGYCRIDGSSSMIYINAAYAGNPYVCAAVLAHNLCHFAVMKLHNLVFDDPSENEKAADLASIISGLGLVVLSGTASRGWHKYFSRLPKRRKQALGYFSVQTYAQKVSKYLVDEHISLQDIARHNTAWANRLLAPAIRHRGPHMSKLMSLTSIQNRTSIQHFWFSTCVFILCISTVLYVFLQRPIFLNDELRIQKALIAELETSYIGCAKRVERNQLTYGETDSQVMRFIDNERNLCKSLQNRYNYEVNAYNQMLQRH